MFSSAALKKMHEPPDITILVRSYNCTQILMHLGVVSLCFYNWTSKSELNDDLGKTRKMLCKPSNYEQFNKMRYLSHSLQELDAAPHSLVTANYLLYLSRLFGLADVLGSKCKELSYSFYMY